MAGRSRVLTWQAERVLVDSMGRRRIVVRLGKPEMVAELEWRTPVELVRGRSRKTTGVSGHDAFQSLILALQFIRQALDEEEGPLTCDGGEPGDTGFPMFVPQFFGRTFAQKLERTIEAETRRHGARLRRGRK